MVIFFMNYLFFYALMAFTGNSITQDEQEMYKKILAKAFNLLHERKPQMNLTKVVFQLSNSLPTDISQMALDAALPLTNTNQNMDSTHPTAIPTSTPENRLANTTTTNQTMTLTNTTITNLTNTTIPNQTNTTMTNQTSSLPNTSFYLPSLVNKTATLVNITVPFSNISISNRTLSTNGTSISNHSLFKNTVKQRNHTLFHLNSTHLRQNSTHVMSRNRTASKVKLSSTPRNTTWYRYKFPEDPFEINKVFASLWIIIGFYLTFLALPLIQTTIVICPTMFTMYLVYFILLLTESSFSVLWTQRKWIYGANLLVIGLACIPLFYIYKKLSKVVVGLFIGIIVSSNVICCIPIIYQTPLWTKCLIAVGVVVPFIFSMLNLKTQVPVVLLFSTSIGSILILIGVDVFTRWGVMEILRGVSNGSDYRSSLLTVVFMISVLSFLGYLSQLLICFRIGYLEYHDIEAVHSTRRYKARNVVFSPLK